MSALNYGSDLSNFTSLSGFQGISLPNGLSPTYSTIPDGKSLMRQPVGNTNVFATVTTTARAGSSGRHYPFRKKFQVAENADYSQNILSFANWVESSTNDIYTSLSDVTISGSIIVGGTTFYPATWGGATEKVIANATYADSDAISGLTLAANTEYEEAGCLTIPLLIKTITSNFSVGATITGAGGATGVIGTLKGYASLTGGTGTIAIGDTITETLSGKTAVVTGIVSQSGTAPNKVATILFASPVTFTAGNAVTASPSGAVYTVSVCGGVAALTNETGAFVANEAVTGGGGAGNVDFTTTQTVYTAIGTNSFFLEGALITNDSSKKHLASNPVTTRMSVGNATYNGSGELTGLSVLVAGVGYSSASTVHGYCVVNNVIYTKSVGNTNTAHTTVSLTVNPTTPPSGLAAWPVDTVFVVAGGGDFGTTTAIPCFTLISGIPSVPVSSVTLIGNSINRGYTSTDGVGDIYHNFGFNERALNNRCGIINAAVSSATFQGFANATFYQYTFGFLAAHSTTHLELGSCINDITNGNSTATNRTNYNTVKTRMEGYYPSLKTRFNTQMPRCSTTDSGSTEANQTPATGCAAGGVLDTLNADVLSNTNLVSGWTICNPYAVVRGDNPNKWKTPASSTPSAAVNSTDTIHLSAYAGIVLVSTDATIQASYNEVA